MNVLQCYSVTVRNQAMQKSKLNFIFIYIIYINIRVFLGSEYPSKQLSYPEKR